MQFPATSNLANLAKVVSDPKYISDHYSNYHMKSISRESI